jgi:serine/threonine protein kinase
VEKDGKYAFLKAIDLTRPLQEGDVMAALHRVTSEHQFEVEILNMCAGARMDRIVVALDSGVERLGDGLNDVVPYLVFELADGDVRRQLKKIDPDVKLAWWLRALHHASVGLNQLHSRRITHQDLKPSNILSFGEESGFKLGDLGRSTCQDRPGPFDTLVFPGDRSYAPLEILYSYINKDAFERRLCCDCYMLGSMIFFFGLGLGATQLFLHRLPRENWPLAGGWEGSYSALLPMLQNVFSDMLIELHEALGDDAIANELVTCASQLSNPDPSLRGHPLTHARGGRIYSLERYVSIFDRLAKSAEIQARVGAGH